MRPIQPINRYKYTGSYLNAPAAIIAGFATLLFGIIGFYVIEGYTIRESIYMTIITLSTVGFGEVKPLSDAGRTFTSILIILNVGVFAYVVSVFSKYIIEGEIFKNMHENTIAKNISKLDQHIIICGHGRYGKEIAKQVSHEGLPYIIIDKNEDIIQEIRKSEDQVLYIHDDATHDEVLQQARIDHARAIIVVTGDETENLFTVLSARQLNKNINIISRVINASTQHKFKLAGANHVVIPEQIGGYFMSTLITKPGAVEFFKLISDEYESDIHFEEIDYQDLPAELRGKSLQEIDFIHSMGVNVVGHRQQGDRYSVNPLPSTILQEGECFVVIGNDDQLEKMKGKLI